MKRRTSKYRAPSIFPNRHLGHRNRPFGVWAGALGTFLIVAACASPGTMDGLPTFAVGSTSTMAAIPTEIKADGISTSVITVTLRDPDGRPMYEGGDFVSLSTTRGVLGPVKDNGNGTYAATLTAGTSQGTATISGSVNGSLITTGNPTVAFLP
jgi:hypothetical protein